MEIREMQKEIYENKVKKGFNVTDVPVEFCLLYGEVAEAYDAWRKKQDDIGEKLGCGAVTDSLVRVRAGVFTLGNAVEIKDVSAAAEDGRLEEFLMPVDKLFSNYEEITVSPEWEKKCRNGNSIEADVSDGMYRVYSRSGEFLMIGKAQNKTVETVKNFFEVN